MEDIPEQITIQCSNCQQMVKVEIKQLKEDKFYACNHCFSTIPVDTGKLLEGLNALMKNAEVFRNAG